MRATKILPSIRALFYAVPAMIGLLSGGCSTEMMSHGWEVDARPVDDKSVIGYKPPELLKLRDGSVEFQYYVQIIHYGPLGRESDGAPEPKLQHRTRRVSPAMLTAPNAFPGNDPFFMTPDSVVWKELSSPDALVRPGHIVPEADVPMDKSGRLVFPDRECFLAYSDYLLWYIPPARKDETPRVALLATDE